MDIFEKIELYHNLFVISLILCVICLGIAVILFFVLDIREVFGYLTGRSARKKIKELEEENAATGRLSRGERNMQYVAQEMKNDMGVRGQVIPGARKVEHVVESQPQQAISYPQQTAAPVQMPPITETPAQSQKTADIFRQTDTGATGRFESEADATGLLQTGHDSETSLLNEGMLENDSTAALKTGVNIDGMFRIERELMFIHTDEVI